MVERVAIVKKASRRPPAAASRRVSAAVGVTVVCAAEFPRRPRSSPCYSWMPPSAPPGTNRIQAMGPRRSSWSSAPHCTAGVRSGEALTGPLGVAVKTVARIRSFLRRKLAWNKPLGTRVARPAPHANHSVRPSSGARMARGHPARIRTPRRSLRDSAADHRCGYS